MTLEEGQFRNLGIRAGSVRGIEVWISWLLVILAGLQLLGNLISKPPAPFPFQSWLVSMTALFLSVFLHELGHCFAAHRVGGSAERIVLWPLGGLAYCDAPQEPRAQFLVAVAGLLVNAALAMISASVSLAMGWSVLPYGLHLEEFRFLEASCQFLFLWNVFLFILNILPCYPIDGGRILQAFIWSRVESYGHATFITLRISQVTAVFCLVTGLLVLVFGWLDGELKFRHPLLSEVGLGFLLLAFLHFVEARTLQHRLLAGGGDDGIFGYDFSRGYTSLERTATRERKRVSLLGSLREKFRERSRSLRRQEEADVRQKVDALLEKIHREGLGSLTSAEERFLKKASKLMRK